MAQFVERLIENITEYPTSFERQGAFPLERYSVFYSEEEANTYAKSNLVSYVGQPLAIVFEDKVVYYIIGREGELVEQGTFKDIDALNQKLDLEIERAKQAEQELHLEILAEAEAREAADNVVYDADGGVDDEGNPIATGLLPDEIDRAKQAEAALNILIEEEVENREQAIKDLDESIKKALEEENKARVEAEEQLAKAVEDEYKRADAQEKKLAQSIVDERDRAIAEEQMLAESLNKETSKLDILIGDDGEKSARKIANEELAAQLLSGKADADFKTLQELAAWIEEHPEDVAEINQKIAVNAENISKEEKRAIAIEQKLQENIEAEATLRETQINELSDSLKEETQRAIDAELGLADDLKSEQLRATEAEEELSNSLVLAHQGIKENKQAIEAEDTRARTAEAFISEKVDAEAARAILSEERLLASLIAEEQRALEAEELIREDLKNNFNEVNSLLEDEIERAEKSEEDLRQTLASSEEQFEKDLGEEIERATKAEANLTADLNKIYNPEGAEDEDGNKIPSGYLPTETAERVAADVALTELIEKEAERAKQVEDTHTHKVTYTPEGDIDVTLTVIPDTFTFNEADSIGSLPTFHAEYDDEVRKLTFKFGAGTLPSHKQKSITAVTGVSVATKTFTGTEQTVTSEPFKEVTTNE